MSRCVVLSPLVASRRVLVHFDSRCVCSPTSPHQRCFFVRASARPPPSPPTTLSISVFNRRQNSVSSAVNAGPPGRDPDIPPWTFPSDIPWLPLFKREILDNDINLVIGLGIVSAGFSARRQTVAKGRSVSLSVCPTHSWSTTVQDTQLLIPPYDRAMFLVSGHQIS